MIRDERALIDKIRKDQRKWIGHSSGVARGGQVGASAPGRHESGAPK